MTWCNNYTSIQTEMIYRILLTSGASALTVKYLYKAKILHAKGEATVLRAYEDWRYTVLTYFNIKRRVCLKDTPLYHKNH